MLEKHHGTKVILLIDEYDVPLARAFENGYCDQMIATIRSLLGQALKTNDSLKFAVLTGCLRISKESIFTGLNNLRVLSIADTEFDEYFGFTDKEVRELLEYYECSECYDDIKKWYDGYQFGNVEVYCPWDVICHCAKLRVDKTTQPQNYWINTSSNDAVKRFIQESANATTKREIERLIDGEIIVKEIHQELTYPEIYKTIDNIWSLLFTTGYLTQSGKPQGRQMRLAIPNLEIRDIFVTQIMEYFKENVRKDGEMLNHFCDALQNGDAEGVEKIFTEYLRKSISIRDTSVRKDMKENFYHGILLGILGVKDRWGVSSNRETADQIIKAAPLHDFGKIAIPDSILNKPGKYISEEYEIMKLHAQKGAGIVARILKNSDDLQFKNIAANVAHYHHEKWDGTGYPCGLAGEEIPLEARIMALADVFDALVSNRVYKGQFSFDKAFDIIDESCGSHFDPSLCKEFLQCRLRIETLYNNNLD